MKLSELAAAAGLSCRFETGASDPEITALTYDSRMPQNGALFAALPGVKTDGAEYVPAAAERGAVAFLGAPGIAEAVRAAGLPQPVLEDDAPRAALSRLANAFYGWPAQKLQLIGITGTNGKTTTAFLFRHLLHCCGKKAGMLGTIEYDTGARKFPAPLTTPESVDFAAYLAETAAAGADFAAAEVSSHALALDRVAGCRFAAGVFTNLTRDHLDYHKTFAQYAAAKQKLFRSLDAGAAAVINLDDEYAGVMLDGCRGRIHTYGIDNPQAVWNASSVVSSIDGSEFVLCCRNISGNSPEPAMLQVSLPLPGRHNIYNALAAIATLAALGLPLLDLIAGAGTFPCVPGRLEKLSGGGRTVFIDYAHTPDAFEKILQTLKPLSHGLLWAVFGCGGDRDCGKRPQMAAAAEKYADRVVVTNDNPRTEDPEKILTDIRAGFADKDLPVFLADRAAAIAYALRMSSPGDTVVIAGKGHEDYQILGTVKHHFSDREEVQRFFAAE